MSALTRPEYQSDEPSRFAPKWVREGHLQSQEPATRTAWAAKFATVEPAAEDHDPSWSQEADFEDHRAASDFDRPPEHRGAGFEGDVALRQMRETRAFEPRDPKDPRWKGRSKFPLSMLVRTTSAIAIATAGALVYVGVVPLSMPAALQDMFTGTRQSADVATEVRSSAPDRPAKLVGRIGDAAPVGEQAGSASVATPPPAAAPAQSDTARAVKTVSVTPWPASAAPQSSPPPAAAAPPSTSGSVPTKVAPQAALQAVPQPAPVAPGAAAGLITRQLDADEIDALVRRGETFILQGDFPAARLMLQRAAEAGSARAAVTLGATYDPVMLRKVGVVGFRANPELARDWYERAVALGSTEAASRIADMGKN
jgi:hypothetical protein